MLVPTSTYRASSSPTERFHALTRWSHSVHLPCRFTLVEIQSCRCRCLRCGTMCGCAGTTQKGTRSSASRSWDLSQ
eukprot:scaffold51873_cov69-Phaeocystis_antarctica.AAC.1